MGGRAHILYKTVGLQEWILHKEHHPNVMHNPNIFLTAELKLKASINIRTTNLKVKQGTSSNKKIIPET